MADKKTIQVPFDTKGNQMHHPNDSFDFKEYRDNYEFFTTLTFMHFCRGCSAAYAVFVSVSGMRCSVFLKDFEEIIPYLKSGSITGNFTFVKRGQNFGVKLVNTDS